MAHSRIPIAYDLSRLEGSIIRDEEFLWRQAYSGRKPLVGGGGLKRGGCVCGAVVVLVGVEYRLPIFEGGKEGDASSSLGCAGCWRLEKCHHPRMAALNSPTEWCSALVVRFVGGDVVPPE